MNNKRRIALASFPRSGNTWMRRMIEEATGELSGSVYSDRVMPRESEGVVIKTHRLDSFRYSNAIHIIRHPLDAITSFYHWRRQIAGIEVSWENHKQESAIKWKKHTNHWLSVPYEKSIVKFEDMKTNTKKELKKVLQNVLGVSLDNSNVEKAVKESRIQNAKSKLENEKLASKFYRKGETKYERFSKESKKI